MEWTTLADWRGPVLEFVSDTREGLPIADLARIPDGVTVGPAIAAALAQLPGWLMATEDANLAAAALSAGATRVRHAHLMSAPTAPHADAPAIRLVPRADVPIREYLDGWMAAYPPRHPDHETGSDEEIIARCWTWYDEPPWLDREHRSSGLVVADGAVIGGIIVSLRPQPPPYGGPWVHDVWRVPGPSAPGLGYALIDQAMRMLAEDGEAQLGLTVSQDNPARGVYERLGFVEVLQSWTVLLPHTPAPGLGYGLTEFPNSGQ